VVRTSSFLPNFIFLIEFGLFSHFRIFHGNWVLTLQRNLHSGSSSQKVWIFTRTDFTSFLLFSFPFKFSHGLWLSRLGGCVYQRLGWFPLWPGTLLVRLKILSSLFDFRDFSHFPGNYLGFPFGF